MSKKETIISLMDLLVAQHKEKDRFNMLGYCGFFSELLRQELTKKGIFSQTVKCEDFRDTKEGLAAKDYMENLIKTFPNQTNQDESDGIYVDMKKHFDKNGRIKLKVGHVAVIVDDTVYDITGGQFGFHNVYPISFMFDVWKKINYATIYLDDKEYFGMGKIKISSAVVKPATDEKPAFTKW